MPCTLKLHIIAANITGATGEPSEYHVEASLGEHFRAKTTTSYRTHSPVWNERFQGEFASASEMQISPLKMELFEIEGGLVGLVPLDVNLLFSCEEPKLEGWFPIYDSLIGIRGSLLFSLKLEFGVEISSSSENSTGVQLFCSSAVFRNGPIESFCGFVDSLTVVQDPEYHWKDLLRSNRSSNETRYNILKSASLQARHTIAKKAHAIGANAVIGYRECTDLEGEVTHRLCIRSMGTAVRLSSHVKDRPSLYKKQHPSTYPYQNFTESSTYDASPRDDNIEDQSFSNFPSYSMLLKGPRAVDIFTVDRVPQQFGIQIGSVVVARSVKLLSTRLTPEQRSNWWNELREEVRSHSFSLNCECIIGYSESAEYFEDVVILSAMGTASKIYKKSCSEVDYEELNEITDLPNLRNQEVDVGASLQAKISSLSCRFVHCTAEPLNEPLSGEKGLKFRGNPISGNLKIVGSQLCSVCRAFPVPGELLSTTELPEGLLTYGSGKLIQASVCRFIKKHSGEALATEISELLPCMELDIHRQLLFKMKMLACNAAFGLQTSFSLGNDIILSHAVATAIAIPQLPWPHLLLIKAPVAPDNKQKSLERIHQYLQWKNLNNLVKLRDEPCFLFKSFPCHKLEEAEDRFSPQHHPPPDVCEKVSELNTRVCLSDFFFTGRVLGSMNFHALQKLLVNASANTTILDEADETFTHRRLYEKGTDFSQSNIAQPWQRHTPPDDATPILPVLPQGAVNRARENSITELLTRDEIKDPIVFEVNEETDDELLYSLLELHIPESFNVGTVECLPGIQFVRKGYASVNFGSLLTFAAEDRLCTKGKPQIFGMQDRMNDGPSHAIEETSSFVFATRRLEIPTYAEASPLAFLDFVTQKFKGMYARIIFSKVLSGCDAGCISRLRTKINFPRENLLELTISGDFLFMKAVGSQMDSQHAPEFKRDRINGNEMDNAGKKCTLDREAINLAVSTPISEIKRGKKKIFAADFPISQKIEKDLDLYFSPHMRRLPSFIFPEHNELLLYDDATAKRPNFMERMVKKFSFQSHSGAAVSRSLSVLPSSSSSANTNENTTGQQRAPTAKHMLPNSSNPDSQIELKHLESSDFAVSKVNNPSTQDSCEKSAQSTFLPEATVSVSQQKNQSSNTPDANEAKSPAFLSLSHPQNPANSPELVRSKVKNKRNLQSAPLSAKMPCPEGVEKPQSLLNDSMELPVESLSETLFGTSDVFTKGQSLPPTLAICTIKNVIQNMSVESFFKAQEHNQKLQNFSKLLDRRRNKESNKSLALSSKLGGNSSNLPNVLARAKTHPTAEPLVSFESETASKVHFNVDDEKIASFHLEGGNEMSGSFPHEDDILNSDIKVLSEPGKLFHQKAPSRTEKSREKVANLLFFQDTVNTVGNSNMNPISHDSVDTKFRRNTPDQQRSSDTQECVEFPSSHEAGKSVFGRASHEAGEREDNTGVHAAPFNTGDVTNEKPANALDFAQHTRSNKGILFQTNGSSQFFQQECTPKYKNHLISSLKNSESAYEYLSHHLYQSKGTKQKKRASGDIENHWRRLLRQVTSVVKSKKMFFESSSSHARAINSKVALQKYLQTNPEKGDPFGNKDVGVSKPLPFSLEGMLSPTSEFALVSSLSSLPFFNIERNFGMVSFFFIKESSASQKTETFYQDLLADSISFARAYVQALGGNALLGYQTENVFLKEEKGSSYALISVSGDVVIISPLQAI